MRVEMRLLRKHLRLPADAPPDVIARALAQPRVSLEAEHAAFMKSQFPKVAAAGRYAALPGGLPDPTPISDRPNGPRPASRPPTGDVTRPPQKPPSSAPREYVGPPVAPASPSTTVTPLEQAPPPATAEEARRRRLGYGFLPQPRQGAAQTDFTWA